MGEWRDIRAFRRPGGDQSSAWVRSKWGAGSQPLSVGDLRSATVQKCLYTGAPIAGGVHKSFAPVVDAMSHVMRKHNYIPVDPGCWGIARRRVRGGKSWSIHAYGAAVDISAPTNPMAKSLRTDMSPALVADLLAIRTVAGATRALVWGGFWTRPDPQHWQANVAPNDLAGGVATADGATFGPDRQAGAPRGVMLRIGSKGPAVTAIQTALAAEGFDPGRIDGAWGPATDRAVRRLQSALGLRPDGIWGPVTERAYRARVGMRARPQARSMSQAEASDAVIAAYRSLLGREPEGGPGPAHWVERLVSGELSGPELVSVIGASPEAVARSAALAAERATMVSDLVAAIHEKRHGSPPDAATLSRTTAAISAVLATL